VTFAPYTFTVTFDGQSATVGPTPSTKTVTAPATTVDALPTDPQRGGYRFDGWYTGTNGAGTPFVGSTNVTQTMPVYAKWTPVYSVTYNGNGSSATVPVDANKYQNGQTVSVLSGIALTDYTFAGWNTQADTLGANYLSGNTFPMGSVNVVLYAKWRMNQPVISTQPVSQITPVNSSATFTISATGLNLEYQWQKNNVAIFGANQANYTPPALSVADTLVTVFYKCIVSNSAGSVTSNAVTLAVSTVADGDENVYHQVKIGNQVWTVENLRTTRYIDGNIIPHVTDSAAWCNLGIPAFCFFNNATGMATRHKWGALYNWYVVSPENVSKITPTGWHVPTDADWDTLNNYLIANKYNWDETMVGNKIAKSMAAKTDWSSSTSAGDAGNDIMTNNKSCFSALPGGLRMNNGSFLVQNLSGFWWSATEKDAPTARNRFIDYDSYFLNRSYYSKSCGFSVRMLRN
jgi:uncharacterized protein (TIGR02145 family)/uncharacterized repeat protein (TIGR02543 family)